MSILFSYILAPEKCKLKCRRYKGKRSMPGNVILSGPKQETLEERIKAWNNTMAQSIVEKASI